MICLSIFPFKFYKNQISFQYDRNSIYRWLLLDNTEILNANFNPETVPDTYSNCSPW